MLLLRFFYTLKVGFVYQQDFGTIKESLNEQNAESSLPNENHENDENYQLDTDKLDDDDAANHTAKYTHPKNVIIRAIIIFIEKYQGLNLSLILKSPRTR